MSRQYKYMRHLLTTLLLTIFFILAFDLKETSDNLKHTGKRTVNEISPVPTDTVGMTNTMKFTPDTVRINRGETVVFVNSSLLAHTVTGDPSQSSVEGSALLPEGAEPFDSGMMDPEETFSHTFEVEGTYKYFCIPHEGAKMIGWVIVEGS